MFGGFGFLSKTTNASGLRCHVLDTKFVPRCDVTQPLVLTGIRQDISARKCVARMISPPRQHTSCSSKVISASASIDNLLHRARMPWILEHPCDSWLCDVPEIQTLAPQPRTAWALAFFYVFLDHRAGSERCFWLGTWKAGICTVLLASVLGQVDVVELQDKNMSAHFL